MTNVSRRQFLGGASAILGSGLLPAAGIVGTAWGKDISRPDYMVRACFNENPWGPSRVALRSIVESIKMSNLYGGDRQSLIRLMSELNDIPEDHICVGTGSGEVLRTAGMIAAMNDGSVVAPDPTYHDLVMHASRNGADIIRVPVKRDSLEVDLDRMHKAIRRDTKCIYIANPNNPIPSIIEKSVLRDFVLDVSRDRMVFIDEAYFEFVDNPDYGSMLDLVRDGHRNIVVSRTASKIHGLAGMRTGFGFAHPDLIEKIENTKTGALNILGIGAVYDSYKDEVFQEFTIRKNRESLDIVESGLDAMDVRYIKSNANFTFIHTGQDVKEVVERFRQENILVGRPFPPMTDWLRVSMAKPHEMEYFVQVYRKLLG